MDLAAPHPLPLGRSRDWPRLVRDGTLLGTVQADLVPDLLRVDERCDVYVAEESGHVSSFAAAARLSLVT